MKEITGNLWDYYQQPGHVICLTTNGTLKANGEGVMGRGCAREATKKVPGIARVLGDGLRVYGNIFQFASVGMTDHIVFFPVKHNWWEKASTDLIQRSAQILEKVAKERPDRVYVLPRPGCGNGKLKWSQVRPYLTFLPDNVWIISPESAESSP